MAAAGLVVATPEPCSSLDEVKSLLQDADVNYRLANFGEAYKKCQRIVSGPVFDSLKEKKEHDVVKAYIKYASCHNKSTDVYKWLVSQAESLQHQPLYVCEWVCNELPLPAAGPSGGSVPSPWATRQAEVILKDVIERARASRGRNTPAVLEMAVSVLIRNVWLPWSDPHKCAQYLDEAESDLSPATAKALREEIQARSAEMERDRPVVAARRSATWTLPVPVQPPAPGSLWSRIVSLARSAWAQTSHNVDWKMAAALSTIAALAYALYAERSALTTQSGTPPALTQQQLVDEL